MAELIMEMLVGMGELMLIMGATAVAMLLAHGLSKAVFKKK
jgi:hypothetical protein